MTGMELLKKELVARGATKVQIESKILPLIVEVIAGAPDGTYTTIENEKEQAAQMVRDARLLRAQAQNRWEAVEKERREHQKQFDADNAYISAFNDSLKDCETAEGRDRMRIAQLYINSVSIDTKYDNTAFIVGLGAILSGGSIGAIEELRKINPLLAKRTPDYVL